MLVGCQWGQSSSSIKSNLTSASYKVDEYTPEQYSAQQSGVFDHTKVKGIQTILVAYKNANGKDYTLIVLIFDSIDNASNFVQSDASTAFMRFGSRYADEGSTSGFGSANNVVWAGSNTARQEAKIGLI